MKSIIYSGVCLLALSILLSSCERKSPKVDEKKPIELKSQSPDIQVLPFNPDPDFFKLPDGMNMGEATGVDLEDQGNIFVSNRGKNPILEFDKDGKLIRTLGKGLFANIHGLRIDKENNIWATDAGSHIVLKIDQKGHIQMVLGRINVPGESNMHFNQPTDVAFGPQGEIFVSDGYGNSRIVKFDKEGNFIKAWGKPGSGPGEFNLPHTMVVDKKGNLYVGDRENHRIQIFDLEGNFLKEWKHAGAPWGLDINEGDTIFMSDGYENRIVLLDTTGKVLGAYGTTGKTPGKFVFAHGIAAGKMGDVFVSEVINWRVQRILMKN